MANQLNQVPSSLEPIGTFGAKDIPVQMTPVWYKFMVSVSSLFTGSSGGSTGASAILDTIGYTVGGMLGRFGSGWQEFAASAPNQIPVMNPSPAPLQLRTISQLLDLISAARGSILFRGALGWQVLAPAAGRYLQSQGPGADPLYAIGISTTTVATGLAATGVAQEDALALIVNWNEITAVPVGSGVKLGALGVGQPSKIWNAGVNALLVYPPVGGQIDALGVNNPYNLAINKCQEFDQLAATAWRSTQSG